MEELVKLVSQKAGIPEETAKTAVETVMGFIKERLPGPIAQQVEAALNDKGTVQQASNLLGGLLGGKK